MKKLERLILVQFFVMDAEEIHISGNTSFLGHNGAGKTALLDAMQIAMLGGNGTYIKFNVKKTGRRSLRNIRDYCLGTVEPSEEDGSTTATMRKRESAHTYITMVFRDEKTNKPISAGISITASADDPQHRVRGLYVANGLDLNLDDHIEVVGTTKQPLTWKDFEAHCRRRCQQASCDFEITDHAERHVRNLLHALQPRAASIDPHEFQKAFSKTLLINNDEDVNRLVRDFVIERERIDRSKSISLIERFRDLHRIVVQKNEELRGLRKLASVYGDVKQLHQQVATWDVLAATFQTEQLSAADADGHAQLGTLQLNLDQITSHAQGCDQAVNVAQQDYESATLLLGSNDAARELQAQSATLQERERGQFERLATLQRPVLQVETVLRLIDGHQAATAYHVDARAALQSLAEAQAAAQENDFGLLLSAVQRALATISPAEEALGNELAKARLARDKAAAEYEAAVTDAERQRRGGVALEGGPRFAVDALKRAGIRARPVCELVEVTRPEWARAVETFLGSNRFALLVEPGKEDEAVRIIRRRENRIAGVKIIQPSHFDSGKLSGSDPRLVGSLIAGDDQVAVGYVRQLLGRLVMVETEEQLRLNPRALTVDGMLSKSGATESLRIDNTELVLGRVSRAPNDFAIRRELERLLGLKAAADEQFDKIEKLYKTVAQLGTSDAVQTEVARSIQIVSEAQALIDADRARIASLDTQEIAKLRSQHEAAKSRLEQARAAAAGAHKAESVAQGKLTELETKLRDLDSQLAAARNAIDVGKTHQDYDATIFLQLRARAEKDITGNDTSHEQRLHICEQGRQNANGKLAGALTRAGAEFAVFVERYRYSVIDERVDWRKAVAWIESTASDIEDSKVKEYEPQAAEARKVAEDAFRRDVIFKIREGMQRMETNLEDMNAILASCPAFSNDVHYKFEAPVASVYKALHNAIKNASDPDQGDDLFGDDTVLSKYISELMDHASDTTAEPSPLDDFRLMFNFDLAIYRGTRRVSTLSRHMRTGSNGEHLTPFYVIAGAALNHAYRTDGEDREDGTALMLLDEAFTAMDETNTLAAAGFLKGSGIQMLMAAPSADSSKLMMVSDTMFEMYRFGFDLHFHREVISADGHRLMSSDVPSVHPELVQQRIASHGKDASTSS